MARCINKAQEGKNLIQIKLINAKPSTS